MAERSEHEQIGWMLQQVASALGLWIASLDAWPDDVANERRRDPQQQLRVLLEGWHRTFRDHVNTNHKTYVHELRDVRNRWAHHDPFSDDDVWRALDTAQRLMEGIGATETTARLAAANRLHLDRSTRRRRPL